jgi:hypothetical protein
VPLAIAVSAYWIVPSLVQLASATNNQLATISSWSWTEGRATLANAYWLNTAWSWIHPEYYPFASIYGTFPLSVLRFAPAILALAGLAIVQNPSPFRRKNADSRFRLAVVATAAALSLIVISTGTNPPGNLVFDPLYTLPYGWLLREPGRFLIVADLLYAILIALTVDAVITGLSGRNFHIGSRARLRVLVPLLLAILVVVPGLPLLTGVVVPEQRPLLPSAHVRIPNDWTEMGAFIDSLPTSGSVLVLPPDDFYQMPYTWGYYGTDSFIGDVINRPVLVPSGQGYIPATPQLLGAVQLTAQSILAGNWRQVEALLDVLGTPLILVRGDIDTTFPNRNLISPAALEYAFSQSSSFDLLHVSGPLHLYALRTPGEDTRTVHYYATVDTTAPDLRVLPLLPTKAALISGRTQAGVPFVEQFPPVNRWTVSGNTLIWTFAEPHGWASNLMRLDAEDGRSKPNLPSSEIVVTRTPNQESDNGYQIKLQGTGDLTNGDFAAGLWGPVGDCADFAGTTARPYLSATIQATGGPNGGPYLQLAARQDSACEAQRLNWHGGPVVVTFAARHVSGASLRLCLWETGPQRCASLPPVVDSRGWSTYRESATPDGGTRALDLFVYADAYAPGTLTRNDYADFQVLEFQSLPQFDLVGVPLTALRSPALVVQTSSYSPSWVGPAGSRHVLVDGLLNGWFVSQQQSFSVRYVPGDEIEASRWVSVLGLLIIVGLVMSMINWRSLPLIFRWQRKPRA